MNSSNKEIIHRHVNSRLASIVREHERIGAYRLFTATKNLSDEEAKTNINKLTDEEISFLCKEAKSKGLFSIEEIKEFEQDKRIAERSVQNLSNITTHTISNENIPVHNFLTPRKEDNNLSTDELEVAMDNKNQLSAPHKIVSPELRTTVEDSTKVEEEKKQLEQAAQATQATQLEQQSRIRHAFKYLFEPEELVKYVNANQDIKRDIFNNFENLLNPNFYHLILKNLVVLQ